VYRIIIEKRACCNKCGWWSPWEEGPHDLYQYVAGHVEEDGSPCWYATFRVEERCRDLGRD